MNAHPGIIKEIKVPAANALRATGNVIKNMGYVLNVKDVLSDAHNTFIKSTEAKDTEQELQLEDILRRDKAFNWSDEEINNYPDENDIEEGNNNLSASRSSSADLIINKGGKKQSL